MLQPVRTVIAIITSMLAAFAAHAQVYPAKPLRLILPVSAGSGVKLD